MLQEISFIKTVRSFLIGAFESEVRDLLLYIQAKEKENLKIILNWALIRQKPLINLILWIIVKRNLRVDQYILMDPCIVQIRLILKILKLILRVEIM